MSPEEWGPPIWTLFHTLAEKIKEESFPIIGRALFAHIYKISSFLPCPECSQHAKAFLGKIHPNKLQTKTDLKNILYVFHNVVNRRKKKPMCPVDRLNGLYEKRHLHQVVNHFLSVYNTKGNMNLIMESFHRQFVVKSFKTWIVKHIEHFSMAAPAAVASPTAALPTLV